MLNSEIVWGFHSERDNLRSPVVVVVVFVVVVLDVVVTAAATAAAAAVVVSFFFLLSFVEILNLKSSFSFR